MNIGRAHLCAALGELSSEHVVFNIYKYIYLFLFFVSILHFIYFYFQYQRLIAQINQIHLYYPSAYLYNQLGKIKKV